MKVSKVPSPPFDDLSNSEKGRLGEKVVEYVLRSLKLKDKDFREYPQSGYGQNYPDFSDGVEGKNPTFEIEVKNLKPTTEVSPNWTESHVLTRFDEITDDKVCIIFGGSIYSGVSRLLEEERIQYIHYDEPIEAEDYFEVFWDLKDRLLDIPSLRKRVIVSIRRIWNSGGIVRQYLPILLWVNEPELIREGGNIKEGEKEKKYVLRLNHSRENDTYEIFTFPEKKSWTERGADIQKFFEENETNGGN